MNRFRNFVSKNRWSLGIGALIGYAWTRTEPDGNLLVTNVCTFGAAAISYFTWQTAKAVLRAIRGFLK